MSKTLKCDFGPNMISRAQGHMLKYSALQRRSLGGYDDMLRLERELKAMKAAGKRPKMVIDQATGKRKLVEA